MHWKISRFGDKNCTLQYLTLSDLFGPGYMGGRFLENVQPVILNANHLRGVAAAASILSLQCAS